MKKILTSTAFRIGVSLLALGYVIYCLHDKLGEAVKILTTEVNGEWFGIGVVA